MSKAGTNDEPLVAEINKVDGSVVGPIEAAKLEGNAWTNYTGEPKINLGHGNVKVFYKSEIETTKIKIGLESPMMQTWISRIKLSRNSIVTEIEIHSIDLEEGSQAVQYVKMSAICYTKQGYQDWLKSPRDKIAMEAIKKQLIPGICFLRGPSAAVLIVIKGEEEDFAVLTVEPCFAVVKNAFLQLPTGKIDETGDFVGKAATELRNNLNLELRELDMVNLTQLAFGNNFPGVFPSAGGCDEHITLYLYQMRDATEQLESWRAKLTGELQKDQFMALKIVPLKELWRVSPDSKSLSAFAIHQRLKLSGILS